MAVIGSIAVLMKLNSAKFIAGIKDNQKAVKRFEAQIRRTFNKLKTEVADSIKSISKWGAALGAAAAIGGAALVKSSLDSIDKLTKVSEKLGATTEGLVSLRLAAEETSGVASGQFDTALQRMTRRVAEAAAGTGEAKKALEQLGLDAAKINGLTADEKFIQIADAMQNVQGEANQLAVAFKLFDTEGAALVTTLKLGRSGLERYKEEAGKLGLVLSAKAAKGASEAKDQIGKAWKLIGGLKTQAVAALAPAIRDAVKAFKDWILDIASAHGGIQNLGKVIAISLLTAVRNVASGFQLVIDKVTEYANQFGLIEDPQKKQLELLDKQRKHYIDILDRYDRLGLKDVDRSYAMNGLVETSKKMLELKNKENTAIAKGVAFLDAQIQKIKEMKNAKMAGSKGAGGGGEVAAAEYETMEMWKQYEKRQQDRDKYLTQSITQIENAGMTELQRVQATEDARNKIVNDARARGLISEMKQGQLLTQIHDDAEKQRTEITKKQAQLRAQTTQSITMSIASMFQSIASLQGAADKKRFEKQKKWSRASILASTAVAIMKAWELPWPANLGAAAAAALTGAAQLVNLNRTTFGGGGTISAGGGGGAGGIGSGPTAPNIPTLPTTQQAAQGPQVNIHVNGPFVANEAAEAWFARVLKDAADADHITLSVIDDNVQVTTAVA